MSAFVATDDVMQVFHPGDHGSTFGGNPLAAAVAMAALDVLIDENLIAALGRARRVAARGARRTCAARSSSTCAAAGCSSASRSTRDGSRRAPVVDRLLARGILSKDTHGTVVRIAPPLNIPREDLAWAVGEIRAVFRDLEGRDPGATA